jgi:restriction endonuclease S subunit
MGELKPYENYKSSGIAWLGEIPENWEEASLRKLFIDNKIKNESLLENNLLTLSYGRIKNKDINTVNGLLPASFSGYQIVDKGDIVLRLLDLQNDKNSLRVGFVNESGIITSAYIGLKSKRNTCSKYYYHLFHFLDTIKHFYNCGGGVRQSMGFSELGKEKILIPSLQEQTLIANFLDFKLSKIDRFIRMKKSFIKLLNEQKAGIINQAVTKGVPKRSFRLGSTTAAETNRSLSEVEVNTAEPCDVEAKQSVNAAKTCVVVAKQSVNAANTCDVASETCDTEAKTCDAVANGSVNAAKTCNTEPNRSLSGVETTDVPMKPSGIEWLGDIPEHWEVRKTKVLFKLITDFAPENNDEELLSIYTEIGVKPRKELEAKGNKASTTDNYWQVKIGDIIVNKLLAWMGAIGVSEYNGVTSPAYDILRSKGEANPYYFHYLFRNPMTFREFKRHSRGIMDMRLRLYFSELGNIYMPLPPYQEQTAIVNFIESETSQINSILSTIEKEISLVQEYRTALIAEAVTGKIDVRDYPISLGWENDENEELINEELMNEELINEGVEE